MPKPIPALCYASLAWADLGRARALFAGLRRLHPDWRYVAAIADAPEDVAAQKDFAIVRSTRVAFMDAACREGSAQIVIHFDSRAEISAPLTSLLKGMDAADILLLARFNRPSPDRQGLIDLDLHIARTGTFNIGFLAVRTSGEGPAFAAWWADRVANYADDIAPDGYADQRWCDLAPALFDRVAIVREPPPGLVLPLDH